MMHSKCGKCNYPTVHPDCKFGMRFKDTSALLHSMYVDATDAGMQKEAEKYYAAKLTVLDGLWRHMGAI